MERLARETNGSRLLDSSSGSRGRSASLPRMKVCDFFSGCGGTSAGLRAAGLEVAVGLDCDREAGLTFKRNFPEAIFIERDIRQVTAKEMDPVIGLRPERG